jgi:hypothetical protein
MENDLDILVLGSKNGGGKTSVLECCSLLLLGGIVGDAPFAKFYDTESLSDVANLLIKSGHRQAVIKGDFEAESEKFKITLTIKKENFSANIEGDSHFFASFRKNRKQLFSGVLESALSSILAWSGEPFIIPLFLYFNSYRKVQESNPELGMMADDYPSRRPIRFAKRAGIRNSIITPVSSFKFEILRSLMGRASLFEGFDKSESEIVLSQLNGLIDRYCGGRIGNLRPLPDNAVDIRIKPKDGEQSFSFDGLSSGQKEMIATLFLIWKNTHENPGIVLIDEPELHLNTEWHGDFVEQLHRLAPYNQYILATHSQEIFRSVEESQRAILVPSEAQE